MLLTLNLESLSILIDIQCWKSELNNRVEFFIVFADNEEIFLNLFKPQNQDFLYEHSASNGFPEDIKTIVIHRITTLPEFPFNIY